MDDVNDTYTTCRSGLYFPEGFQNFIGPKSLQNILPPFPKVLNNFGPLHNTPKFVCPPLTRKNHKCQLYPKNIHHIVLFLRLSSSVTRSKNFALSFGTCHNFLPLLNSSVYTTLKNLKKKQFSHVS